MPVKGAPKIRGCRPGVWRWGVGCLPGKDAGAYTRYLYRRRSRVNTSSRRNFPFISLVGLVAKPVEWTRSRALMQGQRAGAARRALRAASLRREASGAIFLPVAADHDVVGPI